MKGGGKRGFNESDRMGLECRASLIASDISDQSRFAPASSLPLSSRARGGKRKSYEKIVHKNTYQI